MEEFIREQIKDKPINKKKVKERIITSALSGVAFGLGACLVVGLFLPGIMGKQNSDKSVNVSEVSEHLEEPSETESETKKNKDKSEEVKKIVEVQSLSIDDYQDLQSELYYIGGQVNKSIVTVNSVKSDVDWFNNAYESDNQGTGIIVKEESSRLLILTEKKALGDSEKISVTFKDDTLASAELVKYDGNTNIAIISVNKEEITSSTLDSISVAEFGNSSTVRNGMIVIALGSPLGTNYSILTGNITSTDNEVTTKDNNYSVLTTDIVASKNGSGVLTDVKGRIVGVVMQDFGISGAENILTAVTISDIKPIIQMLMDGKDIPYLGAYVTTVTESIAKDNGIPTGVYIKEVVMDSPAMEAGLQSGDVITAVNGEAVSTVSAYNKRILALEPGEKYTVTVKRQGSNGYSKITCKVKIGILE